MNTTNITIDNSDTFSASIHNSSSINQQTAATTVTSASAVNTTALNVNTSTGLAQSIIVDAEMKGPYASVFPRPEPAIITPTGFDHEFPELRMPLPGFDLPQNEIPMKLWTPRHEADWRDYVSIYKLVTPDEIGITDMLFIKPYADTVEDIGGRKPINGHYAGQKFPLEEKFPELHAQYGDVWFKPNGCPDFTPFAIYEVKVEGLIGDHDKDFKLANKAAGIKELPEDYTWHHVEDGITMQAVPKDLHKAVKHTGGSSKLRYKKGQNK